MAVAAAASITALVLATPADGHADEIHLPIVGNQFITVGADLRAGPIIDWSDDDLRLTPVAGPRARLGLHHVVTDRLSMNAEGAFGVSYIGDHPVAFDGDADSQISFDFSLTALGRYLAIGPRSGWTFAGGVHYRRASLDVGSLLQFGLDTRIGYHLWTDDERFFIVELGLHAPLIEGLSVSQQTQQDFDADSPEGDWYFPSASLGIQWAF